MQESDIPKFTQVMTVLAEIYGANMSGPGIEARFIALEEYSIEKIEEAGKAIIRERKYTKMPTPADFIEHLESSTTDVAALEALDVLQKIKSIGSYDSVTFADPVTMAVIDRRFGGWPRACELEEPDEKWFLRDFVSAYSSIAKGGNVPKLPHLPGRLEIENGGGEFSDNGPRRLDATLPLRKPPTEDDNGPDTPKQLGREGE
jgi:hypothetical protein